MNVIDIGILIIVGISVLYGIYHGFLRTVLSAVCFLLSIWLAFLFGPRLYAALRNSTGLTATLATYTDAVARVGDFDLASLDVAGLNGDTVERVITSVDLPGEISSVLKKNLQDEVFSGSALHTVNDYVSTTVVSAALNVFCYIACFLAASLLLSLLAGLISHVFEFPLLKMLDWLAGGAFGALRGLVIVYVMFLAIPIVCSMMPGDIFEKLLDASRLAGFFRNGGYFAGVVSNAF